MLSCFFSVYAYAREHHDWNVIGRDFVRHVTDLAQRHRGVDEPRDVAARPSTYAQPATHQQH